MMYRVCEHCGASLDPGEKCDCWQQDRKEAYTDREREEKRNGSAIDTETRARKES